MPRNNKKTALDTYVEKMGEIAEKFAPSSPMPFKMPEPIKFSNDPGTLELNQFVDEILQVLDGHTIADISAAYEIVKGYVYAQGKGVYAI